MSKPGLSGMTAAEVAAIRRAMMNGLNAVNIKGEFTPCQNDPIPYTEIRQTAEEAEYLCEGCPLLAECFLLGKSEGISNDGMVYGGKSWRLGRVVDTRRKPRIRSKYQ